MAAQRAAILFTGFGLSAYERNQKQQNCRSNEHR